MLGVTNEHHSEEGVAFKTSDIALNSFASKASQHQEFKEAFLCWFLLRRCFVGIPVAHKLVRKLESCPSVSQLSDSQPH